MASEQLLLSGFADEAAIEKTIDQQFSVMAAIGFEYLSIRFVDCGNGIKNIMDLDANELEIVLRKLDEYQLKVSSVGSPIGKVKLLDRDDGTTNRFVSQVDYLENDVVKACQIANRLNTKLIRGFSFYHPKGESSAEFTQLSSDRLREIVDVVEDHDLTFGLEVEANLVGHNAERLMEICNSVNRESLVLIFDGANLVTQGFKKDEIIDQFRKMLPALGWIHIKDHVSIESNRGGYVDEENLHGFVAAGEGESGYPEILNELKLAWQEINSRMSKRGVPGVFADLEPHLKGGGQFGGFSGPDGFGIAARSLINLCHEAGISCPLRTLAP